MLNLRPSFAFAGEMQGHWLKFAYHWNDCFF